MQLPPNHKHEMMKHSLLEKLATHNKIKVIMLDVQYRMPPSLIEWPRRCFYADQLSSFKPEMTQRDLLGGFKWPNNKLLAFVDVRGVEEEDFSPPL